MVRRGVGTGYPNVYRRDLLVLVAGAPVDGIDQLA